MKTIKNKLPKKPSRLIRAALRDFAAVEKNPAYRVNMNAWHSPYGGSCLVCFAGSVMANRFKCSPSEDLYPSSVGSAEDTNRLRALNYFRLGEVGVALLYTGIERPGRIRSYYTVTPYDVDRDQFRADMEKLAARLEKHGL